MGEIAIMVDMVMMKEDQRLLHCAQSCHQLNECGPLRVINVTHTVRTQPKVTGMLGNLAQHKGVYVLN